MTAEWPDAAPLRSARLLLEPLRVDHSEEMAPLLDDVALHTYIGDRPATEAELRDRYVRQVVGHPADGTQRWLNWVVRRHEDGQAVGAVQATIEAGAGVSVAEVAWIIATAHQRQGFAREAAQTMVTWLREMGVTRLVAHVHPDHEGSMGVARAFGLIATDTVVDGEIRWETWTRRA
jgi:RimJ/RimL family protein N-acetyltransferase